MKKKSLCFLLFVTAFLCMHGSYAQKSTKETVIVKTKIYCDHCAECGSCKERIEQELIYTKGIKFAKLDVEKQEIKVVYNPSKTDIDKIRAVINKMGFDADDKMAEAADISKLDECCRRKN